MGLEAYGFIGLTGQEVSRFEIPWEGEAPEKEAVRLEGPAVETDRIRYMKETRGAAPGDVTEAALEGGVLKITVLPVTTPRGPTLPWRWGKSALAGTNSPSTPGRRTTSLPVSRRGG